MRVLFLTLYPESMASARYRVHQFLPYLREQGVECTVACPFTEEDFDRLRRRAREGSARAYHVHEMRRRVAQVWSARRYDVVFVQKAIMSAYIAGMGRYLTARCDRIVYDIDDAVHLAPPHALRGPWGLLQDRGQVQALFAQARLVLAGNPWLRTAAETAGGRAVVFPTVVDTDRFRPAPGESKERADYVVGWMGSPSTASALRLVREPLEALGDAAVRVVGCDADTCAIGGAAYAPWALEDEVDAIRGFSVGIMPLEKSEWDRGKCALKALQYMACGIPCVATPFGAVCDIIEDGVNGIFAETQEDWREALERLRDPEMRRRLGEEARRTVEERYSLRVAAPRMLDHLRTVAAE